MQENLNKGGVKVELIELGVPSRSFSTSQYLNYKL